MGSNTVTSMASFLILYIATQTVGCEYPTSCRNARFQLSQRLFVLSSSLIVVWYTCGIRWHRSILTCSGSSLGHRDSGQLFLTKAKPLLSFYCKAGVAITVMVDAWNDMWCIYVSRDLQESSAILEHSHHLVLELLDFFAYTDSISPPRS